MNPDVMQLLYEATIAKKRLMHNDINYDQAKDVIKRYVDYFNKVSANKAKLFNKPAYKISVSGFLR